MIVLDAPTKVSDIPGLSDAQKAEIIAIAGDFETRRGDYDYLIKAARDDAETLAAIETAQQSGDKSKPHYQDVPMPAA